MPRRRIRAEAILAKAQALRDARNDAKADARAKAAVVQKAKARARSKARWAADPVGMRARSRASVMRRRLTAPPQ